jgi:hypothetical protein
MGKADKVRDGSCLEGIGKGDYSRVLRDRAGEHMYCVGGPFHGED